MSEVVRRTIYFYRDKKTEYNATDGINVITEYIKFHPFCKVNVGGKTYIEPWQGLVTANWKPLEVGFSNFDPDNAENMITGIEEVNPDKFQQLLSGDANNTVLNGGTPNTKVGR